MLDLGRAAGRPGWIEQKRLCRENETLLIMTGENETLMPDFSLPLPT
jgi:hypothetical protein